MRKTCGKKGTFLLAAALALALAGCFTSIADDGSVPDGGDLVVSDENDSTGGGNEAQMPNGTENNDGTGGGEDQTPDNTDDTEGGEGQTPDNTDDTEGGEGQTPDKTDDTEGGEQTETYTVTFDSGNGSAVVPQQVETGQTATKPATDPTKEGYKFLGWYLDGNEFNFATPITADITLTAQWLPVYTVTFDSGNGSAVAPQRVEKGQTATKPADPTKEGYKFLGWYLGGKEFDFATPITANITLTAQWLSYLTIENGVVTKCDSSATGHITIPEGVTGIGYGAFYNCPNLASVTIPASVTYIGADAFFYCRSLAAVTIPEGVTEIGAYAFEKCESLTAVKIPASVTNIGMRAFRGCTNLTSVTFADTSNWRANDDPIDVTNPATNANNLKDDYSEWCAKALYKTAQ